MGIPSVVFIIPAIASVDLSKKNSKEKDLRFRVNRQIQLDDIIIWKRVAVTCSEFKVIIDEVIVLPLP